MKLRKIRIRNLRRFRDFELDLVDPRTGAPRQWTVLVGRNGVGKSDVLQAVMLAASGVSWANAVVKVTPYTLRDDQTGETVELDAELEFTSPDLHLPSWGQIPPGSRLTSTLRQERGDGLLRGESRWASPPELSNREGPDPLAEARRTSNAPECAPAWFMGRDVGMLSPAVQNLDRVVSVLRSFEEHLPGLDAGDVLRRSPPAAPILRAPLSGGEQVILLLVNYLVDHFREAGDPEHFSGLAIIDGIDRDLHPEWQAGIVPALSKTFPNLQFVVSTHSILVVSELKEREVVALDLDADGNARRRPVEVDPRLYTSGGLLRLVFGMQRECPGPLADKLDSYRTLARDVLRDDEEEDAVYRMRKELEDAEVNFIPEILPRLGI